MNVQDSASLSPDTPVDIAQIEAEHGRWLATEGKEGKRANLRGLDLTGADLAGRNFIEASFRGAILVRANLSGADLRAADLAEANLDEAVLTGAHLSNASFARAQLHKTNATGADLVAANFTGAVAEGIDLSDARMNGAILRDANFRQAVFARASLREANLRSASLAEANLDSIDLTSADCRDANFDRTWFAGAILTGTNFRGAKFDEVDMKAADFSVAFDVAADTGQQAPVAPVQAEHVYNNPTVSLGAPVFAGENNHMAAPVEEQQALSTKLARFSRTFVTYALLWILFAGAVGSFTVYVMMHTQDLNSRRVAFLIGIIFLPLLLSFLSMVRCLQLAQSIKTFIALSARPDEQGGGKRAARFGQKK